MAKKRIQNKLQRDKTPLAKELLTNESLITEANKDLRAKLDEEMTKHDTFLYERMKMAEDFKRKTAKKDEDTEFVAKQDEQLVELKRLIEEEDAKFKEQDAEMDKAKKLNRYEENKARDLQQKQAALKAKLQFIEDTYDYKGKVKEVNVEVFNNMRKMNE